MYHSKGRNLSRQGSHSQKKGSIEMNGFHNMGKVSDGGITITRKGFMMIIR